MRVFYKKKESKDSVEITDKVNSFKTSYSFLEDKLLGNTPSLMVEMELNNVDGALSKCADGSFYIETNQVDSMAAPSQEFIVLEAPEKYTSTISLTLYDYMIKLNKPYKSAFKYGSENNPTISQQLDEMSSMVGITIDKSVLPQVVLNTAVGWIDNTIIVRDYIGWIAELSGLNAYITTDNRLSFRKILVTNHAIEYASDFDKTDLMTISRVLFEDGVNSIASGNETGKTIYIDKTNSYCSNQSFTDLILSLYNGAQFCGLENFKTIGFDGLFLGDTITYDGFKCIVTSISRNYSGTGSGFNLDGKVSLKARDSIVTKIPDVVRIRRLQTTLDQTSNSLEIIAKDINASKEELASMKISNSEFITQVTNKLSSSISSQKIYYLQTVSADKPSKNDSGWSETLPSDINPEMKVYVMHAYIKADGSEVRLEPYELGNYDGKIRSINDLITSLHSQIAQANGTISATVEEITKGLKEKQSQMSDKDSEFEKQIQDLRTALELTKEYISSTVEKTTFDGFKQKMEALLDIKGLHIGQDGKGKANLDSDGLNITDSTGNVIAKFTNDDSRVNFLNVREHLSAGSHRAETFNDNLEITKFENGKIETTTIDGTAVFWIGDVK